MRGAQTAPPPTIHGVAALIADIADRLATSSGRLIVGIAGSPGSGKSTLAALVLEAFGPGEFGPEAALVPMDGFHLANEQLDALGRRDRKGAPDTFDADGYIALLRRCRDIDPGTDGGSRPGTVFAPRFVREIEESFAAAIAVPASARIVLTEGNYLLLEDAPWAALDDVIDVRYHLAIDADVRRERLIARHVSFGKSPAAARAWALGPDEANAERIEAAAPRADAIVRLESVAAEEPETATSETPATNTTPDRDA